MSTPLPQRASAAASAGLAAQRTPRRVARLLYRVRNAARRARARAWAHSLLVRDAGTMSMTGAAGTGARGAVSGRALVHAVAAYGLHLWPRARVHRRRVRAARPGVHLNLGWPQRRGPALQRGV